MRRRLTAVVAATLVLGACSGNVSLPAPVESLPTSSVAATTTTTTVGGPTTTAPEADDRNCVGDPKNPNYNATASYPALSSMPSPGQMPAGSPMEAIAKRGKLIVGVSGDTKLFGFRNPLTGDIEGFDIDMLTYVAQAIFGGDFEDARNHLTFRVIPYNQRLPLLENESVDLVAHTMTINCSRWQQIAFSSEYFSAGQRVLVKSDSGFESVADLKNAKAKVCAPESSTNYDELIKPEYEGIQVETRVDVTDCLVAMQQGEVDAASGDDTVLAGLQAQDPTTKVIPDTPFTYEPYGIGVNAEQIQFVEFVNGVLDQIRADGEWKKTYEKWLLPALGETVPDPPQADDSRPVPS